MRLAPAIPLVAFVSLLAAAPPAHAAFIPWKYNWSRNPSIMYSDTSNTSYVTLTDEKLQSAAGSSDIVATNLNIFSDASPYHPATFTNKNYTLTLFLLDIDSNKSATLDFKGMLNGTIDAFSSNLENQFVGPTAYSLVLGQHLYQVTIGPYTPPGPPGSANAGAIAAHASVRVTDIQKTPEPASLVLALCGIPGVAIQVWRRRRTARSVE